MFRTAILLVVLASIPCASAAEYPDMVGTWKAHLRTISSGATLSGEIARGGAVISEVDATVTIVHQDNESFLGRVRLSSMKKDEPSIGLWGAIRSNGKEAIFIGGDGTGGPIWFIDDTSYEFCVASNSDAVAMTAYCGIFTKQTPAD